MTQGFLGEMIRRGLPKQLVGSEDERRGVVIFASSVIAASSAIVASLLQLALGFPGVALASATCAVVSLLAIYVLWRGGIDLAVRMLVIAGFVVVVVYAELTGGHISLASYYLVLMPVFAVASGDARLGRTALFAVMLFFVAHTALAAFFGLEPPNLAPDPPPAMWLINAGTLTVLIYAVVRSMDAALTLALEREQAQRASLERSVQELRTARAQADAGAVAKSRFLQMMSHEVRTPLNGVIGLAELLRGNPDDPARDHKLAIVVESARTLLVMLSNVLEWSRLGVERIEPTLAPVDVRAVLDRVETLLAASGDAARVRLSCRATGAVPPLLSTDEPLLEQMLYNVVGNALKFTAAGTVEVTASYDGTNLALTVVDSGRGMSSEELQSAFRPFAKGPDAARAGSGLGLAITRSAARALGGDVAITSAEGVGTRVLITFPCRAPDDATELARRASAPDPLRVLIVDPVAANRMLLDGLVRELGHETCAVLDDGDVALHRIAFGAPVDLVILDCALTDANGVELARALRSGASASTPWIIGTSAHFDAERRERCLALGMNEVVDKPVTLQDLARALPKRPRVATALHAG